VCRAADRGRLGGKCVQRQQGTQIRPALSSVRSTRTMRVVSSGYTRGDIIMSGGAAYGVVATLNAPSEERLRFPMSSFDALRKNAARRPCGFAAVARRIRQRRRLDKRRRRRPAAARRSGGAFCAAAAAGTCARFGTVYHKIVMAGRAGWACRARRRRCFLFIRSLSDAKCRHSR
jgi:hypothetical protein